MSSSSVKNYPVRSSSVNQNVNGDRSRSQEGGPKYVYSPASSYRYQPKECVEYSPSTANDEIVRLTDSVYQVYNPYGKPRAQIVFFHGIRVHDFKEAYIDTWMTLDRSLCWPRVWLPRYFNRAAVYLVSYDSSASEDSTHGRLDMFTAGEQLLANLLLAKIGQLPNCPLILVGHDLGGLIIKHICMQADRGRITSSQSESQRMSMFLKQIRGVFYFSTAHGGVYLNKKIQGTASDMIAALKPFNKEISRCNEEFRKLRHLPHYKWRTKGVQGSHGRKPGQLNYFHEASGRPDVDEFCLIDTDSDDVCKPKDQTSSSFQLLLQFIEDLIVSFSFNHKRDLRFSQDHSYVPIRNTVEEVQRLLGIKKIVVLYGEPGIGKTSLAKYVALKYKKETQHDSMFWDGCYFVECGRKDKESIQKDLLLELGVDSRDGKDLSYNLQHLDALIVLDEVWEHDALRQLVVPGSNVKYLITTQPSNIWKDDDDIATCRMEKISHNYGRKIIARKVGFRGGLPKEIEGVVEDLLNATDCHPLALATLSMAVHGERKTFLGEWNSVKLSMDTLLERSGVQPAAFGKKYRRGVHASMMCAMERLYVTSRDSLTLLCIIALFEGPSVPIKLIQLFVENTYAVRLRDGNAGVYRLIKELEGRSLVQLRGVRERHTGDMCVTMNGLRQRFILSSERGHVATVTQEILKFLGGKFRVQEDKLTQHNMSRLLCTLYGAQEIRDRLDSVPKRTTTKQGSGESSDQKVRPLPSRAGSSLQTDAEKVLGTYIYGGLQDTDRLIRFSRSAAGAASTICRALASLFLASDRCKSGMSYYESLECAFQSLSNLLVTHKKPAEAIEMLGAVIRDIGSTTGDIGKRLILPFSALLGKEENRGPHFDNQKEKTRSIQKSGSKSLVTSTVKSRADSWDLQAVVTNLNEKKNEIVSFMTREYPDKHLVPGQQQINDPDRRPYHDGSQPAGTGHKAHRPDIGRRKGQPEMSKAKTDSNSKPGNFRQSSHNS